MKGLPIQLVPAGWLVSNLGPRSSWSLKHSVDRGSWAEEGDPIVGQNQWWCGGLIGLRYYLEGKAKAEQTGRGEDAGGAGKGERSQEGLLRSLSHQPSAQASSDVF